jgi:hypothetical protein
MGIINASRDVGDHSSAESSRQELFGGDVAMAVGRE